MALNRASPSATCFGLCFHVAVWVAAGVQKPVNFNAEFNPLCLIQTKVGNSLKIKRQNASTASTDRSSPQMVSTASATSSLLSREHTPSSKISQAPQEADQWSSSVLGSAAKPTSHSFGRERDELSFHTLSSFDDENLEQSSSLAYSKATESMLAEFQKTHQTSFDALPLLDSAAIAIENPTQSSGRWMLLHIILTAMVIVGVLTTAILSTCFSATRKADDAHAILDHISKASVPPEPQYGATAMAVEAFTHLCAMPDLPPGGVSYLIPDLAQMKDGVASFDVMSSNGETILEGVINNEAKDAGILLHQPKTVEEASSPVAFVSTSRAALAFGNTPIVRPRVDQPQGEKFGILKRIADGKYAVVRKHCTVMVIEGNVAERCLKLHTALPESSKGNHNTLGSTQPGSDTNGQARIELQVGCGVDAGLAILCVLAIIRLEASH